LAACWSYGIPVLHVSNFPPHTKKMDGMVVMANGRPTVVVCKNAKFSAWLLYIIAHELGHIAANHLSDNSVLIDEVVNSASSDAEEIAANEYASALVAGNQNYHAQKNWPNARRLAYLANIVAKEQKVDPGHIVLNYAHNMNVGNFYPVANAALRILEPNASGPKCIAKSLAANLDWSALPSESCEFLMKVTGADR
jgi:hypothetical protein